MLAEATRCESLEAAPLGTLLEQPGAQARAQEEARAEAEAQAPPALLSARV